MNSRDLEFHLQDLFDGCLKGAAFETVEEELLRNPEARRAYREHLHLHHALRYRAVGVDLLNVVPMDLVIARQRLRNMRAALLSAAAMLTLGALVMALLLTRTPPPTLIFATSPGTEFVLNHALTGEEAPEGKALEPGSRMEVRMGTVELEFASGVRAIVQGPASLALVREDLLNVQSGTAWFQVPSKKVGFQVTTSELLVTDLGTKFGVISDPNFPDEVHVFSGEVEVSFLKLKNPPTLLKKDDARIIDPPDILKETPARPDRFLTQLPESVPKNSLIVTNEFSEEEFHYANDVSDSDILNGIIPSADGWNLYNQANPPELTDGMHGAGLAEVRGDRVQGAWTQVGASAEFHLGKGVGGLGYDITSVQSIAAWRGEGFANQCWTMSVKPVGGSYHELAEISYAPFETQNLVGGGSTKVTLTDRSGVLARRIESIRIVAGRVPASVDNAFVWREFDVFGKPSSP